jgi:hypothetical protein
VANAPSLDLRQVLTCATAFVEGSSRGEFATLLRRHCAFVAGDHTKTGRARSDQRRTVPEPLQALQALQQSASRRARTQRVSCGGWSSRRRSVQPTGRSQTTAPLDALLEQRADFSSETGHLTRGRVRENTHCYRQTTHRQHLAFGRCALFRVKRDTRAGTTLAFHEGRR